MKIVLNQLREDKSLVLEEELSPDDLDLDIGVMHFPNELYLRAECWKSGNDLTTQIHLEGEREFECSRCLEKFNNVFEKDFTLHYDIKGLESVAIDSDVRDELIMEHPIRIVCRSDCRGLCAFCGANLNEEKCDCNKQEE